MYRIIITFCELFLSVQVMHNLSSIIIIGYHSKDTLYVVISEILERSTNWPAFVRQHDGFCVINAPASE